MNYAGNVDPDAWSDMPTFEKRKRTKQVPRVQAKSFRDNNSTGTKVLKKLIVPRRDLGSHDVKRIKSQLSEKLEGIDEDSYKAVMRLGASALTPREAERVFYGHFARFDTGRSKFNNWVKGAERQVEGHNELTFAQLGEISIFGPEEDADYGTKRFVGYELLGEGADQVYSERKTLIDNSPSRSVRNMLQSYVRLYTPHVSLLEAPSEELALRLIEPLQESGMTGMLVTLNPPNLS